MSHTALIRFAPLTTLERINDPRWQRPGRTMYDPGALTMLPGKTTVPLLCDHDDSRPIGVVRTFTRWEELDGPWLAAIADVTEPPCWLTAETRVSFSYKPAGTSHNFGCEISRRGYVTEVSVLSPCKKPAEPLARVVSFRPTETPKPVSSSRAAGEVFYGGGIYGGGTIRRQRGDKEMEELHRRIDFAGPNADFELILENMKRELGYRWAVR